MATNHGGTVSVWSVGGRGVDVHHPVASRSLSREIVRYGQDSGNAGGNGEGICVTIPLDGSQPLNVARASPMTRVLVVEDEESFSDALSYMLRREGYEVAVAGQRA